jgi:hypothetical protein
MQHIGRLARPNRMSRWWPALLLLALGIATVGVGVIADANPAWASCVESPDRSPYRFTGTVVSTSNADRTAIVYTDDRHLVTVLGSDAQGPDAHTEEDRTYAVGLRYEFDPVNDSSPYQDNLCSATHLLNGSDTAPPAGGPRGSQSGGGRTSWLVVLAVALSASALGLLVLRAMSRRSVRRPSV